MAKLTDTQLLLLSNAAQNQGGGIYPLPASLLENDDAGTRAAKAIAQLVGLGLVVERETNTVAAICRTDGDFGYGMFITSVGLLTIGIEDCSKTDAVSVLAPVSMPEVAAPAPQTKTAAVLVLLQRDDGATVAELIDATGWLPHTTRAALTGLRKKGHDIARSKRGTVTCYRVAA